jgi:hypothetical protein
LFPCAVRYCSRGRGGIVVGVGNYCADAWYCCCGGRAVSASLKLLIALALAIALLPALPSLPVKPSQLPAQPFVEIGIIRASNKTLDFAQNKQNLPITERSHPTNLPIQLLPPSLEHV